MVERWQTLADADGAHGAHERAHNGRDAHVSIVDQRVYIDAQGGVLAGSEMKEIFDRFCDAEFRTDWDAGVAEWGERMNPQLLDRTAGQRRFDALLAVFIAAAASGVVGVFDPLVSLVVDQTTFEYHLATLLGGDPGPAGSGHGRSAALRDGRRPSDRSSRHARRRVHGSRSPCGVRRGRCGHRSRSPVAVVHRWGSRRGVVG